MDSTIFGDPCPGTFKYVEVHYACREGEREFQNSSVAPLNFFLFPIKSRRGPKLFCSPNGSCLLRRRGPLNGTSFFDEDAPSRTAIAPKMGGAKVAV